MNLSQVSNRSRIEKIIAEIERGLDKNNQEQVARLEHLWTQVINNLHKTETRKTRPRTDSKRKGTPEEEIEPVPGQYPQKSNNDSPQYRTYNSYYKNAWTVWLRRVETKTKRRFH